MNQVTFTPILSRSQMVHRILNMRAGYEHLYWASPNVEYENSLINLAVMTDAEIQKEYERLCTQYNRPYDVTLLLKDCKELNDESNQTST